MLEVGESGAVVHVVKVHTETNENEADVDINKIIRSKQQKISRISEKIKCIGNMVTQSVRSTAT